MLTLAEKAGFTVQDYFLSTEGNTTLEKAEKKKRAINIALVLKKCPAYESNKEGGGIRK